MCRADFSSKPVVGGDLSKPSQLAEGDEWLEDFDFEGFREELKALGKKLEREQGPKDVDHLNKMILWSNTFAAIGMLTMGFGVNPISAICLSLYTFTRWTMIAHHTCHGGYTKCHSNKRFSRFKFAIGSLWRRFNDWFDWMLPEAWNVEHNNRHHYNLSEKTDPDLVEENLAALRELDAPLWAKYIGVGFFMCTWKWFYYAPNTYKELKLANWRKKGEKIPDDVTPEEQVTIKTLLFDRTPFYSLSEFMGIVMLPYLIFHFFCVPLPYLWVGDYLEGYTGEMMYWNAVKTLFIAEVITNVHGFIAIVTNHAGDDMYRFRDACRPYSGSFYLRQVLASADFDMGTDPVDFAHGYLNYQIEHHMWPNLSMLSYQKSAPIVREICDRYGVPYVKQNVFIRLKKTVDIMVGNNSMKWFPKYYEDLYLEIDAEAERAKR